MLCSSSMGVPLKSFEPTTLGDNLPLHLSKHKSGCFVTCFHASHVSLFSCTHSIFPSAICSSTLDKSDLSLNQNGEEGSKERGRRYTAVTLHETPVSQPAPVDYCNPDFLLTLLSVSFPTSSKASCWQPPPQTSFSLFQILWLFFFFEVLSWQGAPVLTSQPVFLSLLGTPTQPHSPVILELPRGGEGGTGEICSFETTDKWRCLHFLKLYSPQCENIFPHKKSLNH